MGNGLVAYLWNYYKDGVGVWGYDPVLGAFAPPLRARIHLVMAMILWLALFIYWPLSSFIQDQCISSLNAPLSFFQSGVAAFSIYSVAYFVVQYLFPGVSHPGGPREHKIQRVPNWNDSTTSVPSFASKWRCVVAEESHQISEARFAGTSAALTGESSGRQMWTNVSKDKATKNVDEKLVEEYAAGGREHGFNPSKNPNR